MNCVRGPDAWRPQQPVVEAEHGDNALVRVQRGRSRVVAHPQVAPEPDERGHPSSLRQRPAPHWSKIRSMCAPNSRCAIVEGPSGSA